MSSEVIEQKRKLMIEDQKKWMYQFAGAKTFLKLENALWKNPREQLNMKKKYTIK